MSAHVSAPGELVNLRQLPDGRWLSTGLPDRRHLVVSGDEPIVPVMRKINAAIAACERPAPEWYAAIAEWLEAHQAGQLMLFGEPRRKQAA